METQNLREKVNGRIAYWTNELHDLPDEFSESAYERMKWIQETLAGLHEIKAKFFQAPRPLSPEQKMFQELLY